MHETNDKRNAVQRMRIHPPDRFLSLRRTSVRGLDPGRLLFIVGSLIVCGFAFGAQSAEPETAVVETALTKSEPSTAKVDLHELSPGAQRAALLSDAEALFRAKLWLARVIYSETHRRDEQHLVAWVVRNRVETRYRGESTYADVIRDPFQFSAFNPGEVDRDFFMALDTTHVDRVWRQALDVAEDVLLAEADERPFPITTRHFYSERSLGDADIPLWALEIEPIVLKRFTVDQKRFRFFDGVS